jgi:hypothetical protein
MAVETKASAGEIIGRSDPEINAFVPWDDAVWIVVRRELEGLQAAV